MRNILIIDTETTGLPITIGFDKYYSPKITKYYEKSRLIEIAYIICDEKKNKIKEVSNLIKPLDFEINNSQFHGITQKIANDSGIDLSDALNYLDEDLNNIDTIVAHNKNFDLNIILSECYRQNNIELADKILSKNTECTMKLGKEIMKQYKSPKMVELYKFLFKKEVLQEHRALSDVIICADCYFKMKK
jgi:DNA polymerase III epsilon subunit-like protein